MTRTRVDRGGHRPPRIGRHGRAARRALVLAVWPIVLLGCAPPEARPDGSSTDGDSPPDTTATTTSTAGTAGTAGTAPTTPATADTADRTAPIWSREGLDAQPRMDELRANIPSGLGYSPAPTDWRPADPELPASLTDPDAANAPNPGRLLADVLERLGWDATLGLDVWERTVRVWREGDDRAVGVALQWGLKDDAVAGHDIRIHMRDAGDSGTDGDAAGDGDSPAADRADSPDRPDRVGPSGRWYVTRVEERYHCRRDVTADGRCL